MIKSAYISNFQSWEKCELNFSKGFNVIGGSSDSGKSAIIRALKWGILNRPLGDGFKSNFNDKAAIVEINFDNGNLTRFKGDKDYYSVNDDIYTALRGSVPVEVSELTKMNEINIQSQDDFYFLLQKTSGERARITNDIVGLSIIDEVLKKINQEVNLTTSSLKDAEKDLKNAKEEIAQYDHIENVEEQINVIHNLLYDREELINILNNLQAISSKVEQAQRDITEVEAWLQVESEYQIIQDLLDEHSKNFNEQNQLDSILDSINEVTVKLKEAERKIKYEDAIQEISEDLIELNSNQQEIKSLEGTLYTAVNFIKQIDISEAKLNQNLDELSQYKICPTCEQEIKKWKI